MHSLPWIFLNCLLGKTWQVDTHPFSPYGPAYITPFPSMDLLTYHQATLAGVHTHCLNGPITGVPGAVGTSKLRTNGMSWSPAMTEIGQQSAILQDR